MIVLNERFKKIERQLNKCLLKKDNFPIYFTLIFFCQLLVFLIFFNVHYPNFSEEMLPHHPDLFIIIFYFFFFNFFFIIFSSLLSNLSPNFGDVFQVPKELWLTKGLSRKDLSRYVNRLIAKTFLKKILYLLLPIFIQIIFSFCLFNQILGIGLMEIISNQTLMMMAFWTALVPFIILLYCLTNFYFGFSWDLISTRKTYGGSQVWFVYWFVYFALVPYPDQLSVNISWVSFPDLVLVLSLFFIPNSIGKIFLSFIKRKTACNRFGSLPDRTYLIILKKILGGIKTVLVNEFTIWLLIIFLLFLPAIEANIPSIIKNFNLSLSNLTKEQSSSFLLLFFLLCYFGFYFIFLMKNIEKLFLKLWSNDYQKKKALLWKVLPALAGFILILFYVDNIISFKIHKNSFVLFYSTIVIGFISKFSFKPFSYLFFTLSKGVNIRDYLKAKIVRNFAVITGIFPVFIIFIQESDSFFIRLLFFTLFTITLIGIFELYGILSYFNALRNFQKSINNILMSLLNAMIFITILSFGIILTIYHSNPFTFLSTIILTFLSGFILHHLLYKDKGSDFSHDLMYNVFVCTFLVALTLSTFFMPRIWGIFSLLFFVFQPWLLIFKLFLIPGSKHQPGIVHQNINFSSQKV